MVEKFARVFRNQKVIPLLMCHDLFKSSKLEICKEKSKAGADFGDSCGQHKWLQNEGCKLSSEHEENPMCNR